MTDKAGPMGQLLSLAIFGVWIACTLLGIFSPKFPHAGDWAIWVTAVFALAHGARRYGWGGSIAFCVITLVIANIYENLSITTGFPFGFYTHGPSLGPRLFNVPLMIGPIYSGAGYLAWIIANMILGEPSRIGDRFWTLAMPIVAAFIVVGFDICIDPIGATIAHRWHYAEHGAYFGVPLSNYLGWYLTTWTFFQVFAVYLAISQIPVRPVGLGFWYEVSAYWALLGLQFPLLLLVIPLMVVQDSAGWSWQSTDIIQSSTIMCIYTMLAAAVTGALVVTRRQLLRVG